jgi:hypothetical protein
VADDSATLMPQPPRFAPGARPPPGPDWGPRLGDGLGPGRRGLSDRSDQVARALGVGHDRIRQAHAELLLEPQEQLDALEATDAEVAIERGPQGHRPPRPSAQLDHQRFDDLEHPPFPGVQPGVLAPCGSSQLPPLFRRFAHDEGAFIAISFAT